MATPHPDDDPVALVPAGEEALSARPLPATRLLVVSRQTRVIALCRPPVRRSLASYAGHAVLRIGGGALFAALAVGVSVGPGFPEALWVGTVIFAAYVFWPVARNLPAWHRQIVLAAGRRRRLRAVEGGVVLARLDASPEGARVRVRGRVLPGPTFRSAGGAEGCVLAYYLGMLAPTLSYALRVEAHGEVHALDFKLLPPDGEPVTVLVDAAELLPDAAGIDEAILRRWPKVVRDVGLGGGRKGVAAVHREEVIVVNDEVEVLGVLERAPDPRADGGYRDARLGATLRSAPGRPLLIRRVPSGGAQPR